jgi:hypothetical protein
MTVRGLALAAALLASMPVEAAACHRYSRWYYPWPQSCGAQIRANSRKPVKVANRLSTVANRLATVSPEIRDDFGKDPTIALPSLARADFDGGEADEPTRARLLLRVALEAAYAR